MSNNTTFFCIIIIICKYFILRNISKFIICFFGSVNISYSINYLIDAAEKLNDSRVAIVIVGEGNQKQELMDKTKGREDVIFLPKIPPTPPR